LETVVGTQSLTGEKMMLVRIKSPVIGLGDITEVKKQQFDDLLRLEIILLF